MYLNYLSPTLCFVIHVIVIIIVVIIIISNISLHHRLWEEGGESMHTGREHTNTIQKGPGWSELINNIITFISVNIIIVIIRHYFQKPNPPFPTQTGPVVFPKAIFVS